MCFGTPISKNLLQFVVFHIVKGCNAVSEAEVDTPLLSP